MKRLSHIVKSLTEGFADIGHSVSDEIRLAWIRIQIRYRKAQLRFVRWYERERMKIEWETRNDPDPDPQTPGSRPQRSDPSPMTRDRES